MTAMTTLTCPECQTTVEDLSNTFIPLPPDEHARPDDDADRPQGVVGWQLTPCGHLVRGDQWVITLYSPITDGGDTPVYIGDLTGHFTAIPTPRQNTTEATP